MRLDKLINSKIKLDESRRIDLKIYFCSSIEKLLNYAKILGRIRFIYDPLIGRFIIGNAEHNTCKSLFLNAVNSEKYYNSLKDSDYDEKDIYYDGNIKGNALTGMIIMKPYVKGVLNSAKNVYEYSSFYLYNGLWFKDKISEYIKEQPKKCL